eukprot:XP_024451910.1 uncharacterized protein LOC7497249 isoform X3 [Populus trichocarpa]
MINVLTVLQKDMFLPRIYVAAATDNMSLQKARVLEDNMVDRAWGKGVSVQFMQIYRRSREVGSLQWPWDLCSSVYNCIPVQGEGIIGYLFFMPRIARENILELTMLAVSCG